VGCLIVHQRQVAGLLHLVLWCPNEWQLEHWVKELKRRRRSVL